MSYLVYSLDRPMIVGRSYVLPLSDV